MSKPDFPTLLDPGIHQLTIQQLHELAVSPFGEQRRDDLFEKFKQWYDAVVHVGVGGKIWIDGSFMTMKPNPSDIDCVLWAPAWTKGTPTNDDIQAVSQLMDRSHAGAVYNLDLYLENAVEFDREAYWSGVFGFGHDRTKAKGFAEIVL